MNLFDNISLVITLIFLVVVLSYYVLVFVKRKKPPIEKKYDSITVIVPAHNEELYIKETLQSIIDADFDGIKEVIAVDDGSKDKTFEIMKTFEKKGVKIIKTKHSGKSASMNKAILKAKGELIAIVDGDSYIPKNGLKEMSLEVSRKNVVAACCPVRVRNRNRFICMWLHIAEVYYSLIRGLLAKVNGNITTPGPLSVYRKDKLKEIGYFSTNGYSEDADVTIRLIRKGYKIGFNENTIAETNMPHTVDGFFRQRIRFARGLVNLLKKHMQMNKTVIDLYTLPLFLFGYIQSIIMGSLTIYQIISGFNQYFLAKGIIFNKWTPKFLFEWFTMVGFVKWTFNVLAGNAPLTALAIVGIISTLLTYPLYFFSFIKYDKKIDFLHVIPFFFLSPFWLIIMLTQIIALPDYFKKKQRNIWKKNDPLFG
jgi:cellulose synthase/poly-beta-1,6-N-acetylglucosamine synthase-like glycosyltransferase